MHQGSVTVSSRATLPRVKRQQTLVLLPGLNGSDALFAPLLAHLPPTLDVQVICLPTQGSQHFASIADRLLSELGNTPYVLLGESFSGPLAYQLALRQPPGLQGVIFAASFLTRPHPLLPLAQYLPLPSWLLKQKSLLNLFCLNGHSQPELTQVLSEEIQTLAAHLLRARLHSLKTLGKPVLKLALPALHLLASQDRLLTRNAQNSVSDGCTQLKQIWLNGPHFILQTQPRACADAIAEFIAALTE
ncbi:MAG: alpha/beta hydrolase [Pseudomonas sp.]|uniref:alpha/beta fold hydrolase n=1 Tax=Pseudomonas sp. TaxID=306 RepID=UPI003982B3AB